MLILGTREPVTEPDTGISLVREQYRHRLRGTSSDDDHFGGVANSTYESPPLRRRQRITWPGTVTYCLDYVTVKGCPGAHLQNLERQGAFLSRQRALLAFRQSARHPTMAKLSFYRRTLPLKLCRAPWSPGHTRRIHVHRKPGRGRPSSLPSRRRPGLGHGLSLPAGHLQVEQGRADEQMAALPLDRHGWHSDWNKALNKHNLWIQATIDTINLSLSITGGSSNEDYDVYHYNADGYLDQVVVVVADNIDTEFDGASTQDGQPVGVLTGYCQPGIGDPIEQHCPDWVDSGPQMI